MSARGNRKSTETIQLPIQGMQQTAATFRILNRTCGTRHLEGQIDNIGARITIQGIRYTVNFQPIRHGCLVRPFLAGAIDNFQTFLGQLAYGQIMNSPQPLWICLGQLVETALTDINQRHTRSAVLLTLFGRRRRWRHLFLIVIKITDSVINHDRFRSSTRCRPGDSRRSNLCIIVSSRFFTHNRLRCGFRINGHLRSRFLNRFRQTDRLIITEPGHSLTARHQIIISIIIKPGHLLRRSHIRLNIGLMPARDISGLRGNRLFKIIKTIGAG